MHWRTIRAGVLVAALLLASGGEAQIAAAGQLEQEVDLRAALVLGFARFSEWPTPREGPLVIGVLGRPAMAAALERVAGGKTVNGHPVAIRPLKQAAQMAGCHIVYFGKMGAPKMLTDALAEARGAVLTIGEDDRFLGAGGIVYLFEEDGRMSFEVNLPAMQASNVAISSKLLRLGYKSGTGRRGKGTP